ncbi:aldehyde dehydrogenase [Haloarcula sp. 1CSR25-25]|uniref:aldehyde dehydrogenase n=1 Tax=Haloarcula sp. 1CSR25-25 TaxID=2862545 RepID=UPI00289605E8|nr:aldehyde dehydrogenase [Haloarcula sp. 1CSR25-25]MDT3437164.1 aldehyde dehydrogenase [Haloarcula sp. 1CSR25-25]
MAVDPSVTPLYIDGEWHESEGDEAIPVINPTTEETIAEVPSATDEELKRATAAARAAQDDWAARPAKERGDLLREVADVIEAQADDLAETLVAEQGKTISIAKYEIEASADIARYNAEWDRRIEGDVVPGSTRRQEIDLLRKPYGVVAGIIPWNFPISVFVRKFAPALVAGNTAVIKPSELTPLTTLALMDVIQRELDLPDGVLNVVTGGGRVGAGLVKDEAVDYVTMTGNVDTGKAIMRDAADDLTQVALELGGKAPAIVTADADIDSAVEHIVGSRTINAGQVCTCVERIYVHEDVSAEFESEFVDAMADVEFGDPMADPDMGPQISQGELDKTHAAIEGALEQGAEVATGGIDIEDPPAESGYWVQPTVLTNVDQSMDVIHDEVFGPVAPIVEVESVEQAVEYANDSRYGLSSYVFSNSYSDAMQIVHDLDFGETFVNGSGGAQQGHHIGWNESGLGGEDGKHGAFKYTQLKSVYHNFD